MVKTHKGRALMKLTKWMLTTSVILGLAPGILTASAQTQTHTVKAGEYLYLIAQEYNVTVAQLKNWNNLTSDLLQIGDVLRVTGDTQQTFYTVKYGDTLTKIAQEFNVTVSQLKSWNQLSSDFIRTGMQLRISGPTDGTQPVTNYQVKSGDSLWRIAQTFGLSVNQLKSWNGLTSDLIYPGMNLRLTAPAVDPSPDPVAVYQVKAGDTLWKISNQFGVTISELREWNSLASDVLRIGQRLHVIEPEYSENPVKIYTVKAGDTLYQIARANNITVNELRLWNHLTTDFLSIGQELKIAVY